MDDLVARGVLKHIKRIAGLSRLNWLGIWVDATVLVKLVDNVSSVVDFVQLGVTIESA